LLIILKRTNINAQDQLVKFLSACTNQKNRPTQFPAVVKIPGEKALLFIVIFAIGIDYIFLVLTLQFNKI